ncbi:MAG: hypothetical protein HON47_05420 [Candidatus Diapherotrites archaeon]|jgi:hypothetical protein|uniref:Uncharacterized protein n=1 Tax=Candidatus Iainarchaeum sp. TaxID=3101447 RepID=A0A8T5GH12_9ARCH|nr:hypothetical protein [Candidatus Diapherotrites archaeon]MBT7241137.1 hypothetical protein [Candidatus Diapherotrites archaeon]
MKKEGRYPALGVKRSKKVFNTGSGTLIGLSRNLKRVIKFFPHDLRAGRGNAVYPRQIGRKPSRPITNHKAIEYYSLLMHDAYWKEHSRTYGPQKVTYYRVRPVKLIREGKNYHVTEKINGPNLDDFISYMRGYKFKKREGQTPEQKSDFELRRKGLADLIKTNKAEMKEFKKHLDELHKEINRQMDWIRNNPHSDGIDLYQSNLKESDFIVEGFSRSKTGQLRLKLVMVDYQ